MSATAVVELLSDPQRRAVVRETASERRAQGSHVREAHDQPADDSVNVTEAPNGGYGWIVVFSCSVLTFHFNGFTGSWGVLQGHLLETDLQGVPTSTVTFVGSLSIAFAVAFGLFSIRLTRLVGARLSAVAGVTLLGLAEINSGFTTSNVGGLFGT